MATTKASIEAFVHDSETQRKQCECGNQQPPSKHREPKGLEDIEENKLVTEIDNHQGSTMALQNRKIHKKAVTALKNRNHAIKY
ncbi:hypothetical protein AVEN_202591-1 [Araneus ventricosus]|uniref:Uncharacterized protein n=1 Tax=Araneus ventricosus TaxID=182803 RepID=A0A4Y2QMK5_ARAVE|nr:hypothetical protein AVEN_202591-1 [Araneus ventricosus]